MEVIVFVLYISDTFRWEKYKETTFTASVDYSHCNLDLAETTDYD